MVEFDVEVEGTGWRQQTPRRVPHVVGSAVDGDLAQETSGA
ncbi:MAG: hypothetical protein ABIR68_13545 [Ilumatobacteraceae bacterium]